MSKGLGKNQQKILLLLLGGLALGLSGSPKKYFQILKEIEEEWKEIDRRSLKRAIQSLYESKLIGEKKNNNGTTTLFLTEKGEKKALTYNLNNIKIKKPKNWDGKWRMILFDVPEKRRLVRDSLRYHFKTIGFAEFQKSVFIYPYDCKDEVDFIIEMNKARKYVRFMVVDSIDNEIHMKKIFNIT